MGSWKELEKITEKFKRKYEARQVPEQPQRAEIVEPSASASSRQVPEQGRKRKQEEEDAYGSPDYGALYDKRQIFHDVTFVFSNGEKEFANRNVLSTNCEYFERMFESDEFKESHNEEIRIEEDATVFRILIKYLYYGEKLFAMTGSHSRPYRTRLSNEDGSPYEVEHRQLLDLAMLLDKYLLEKAKDQCVTLLLARMLVDWNIDAPWILATAYVVFGGSDEVPGVLLAYVGWLMREKDQATRKYFKEYLTSVSEDLYVKTLEDAISW